MTLLRRCLVVCAAALALLTGLPLSVDAAVVVTVDKSAQRMSVAVDGAPRYNWAVSTGRAGYGTPNGTYAPTRLERSWFSRQYYNSPMPHSIFFHGGYAIHGSYEISRLGGPASHGCIRLHPSNAATLFRLGKRHGAGGTRISGTGSVRGLRANNRRAGALHRRPTPAPAISIIHPVILGIFRSTVIDPAASDLPVCGKFVDKAVERRW
jgi:hypothetical protein